MGEELLAGNDSQIVRASGPVARCAAQTSDEAVARISAGGRYAAGGCRLCRAARFLAKVDLIKRGILRLYGDDIGKFANGDAGRVRGIFAQIPGQLSSMRNDSLWHRSIRGLDLVNTIRRSSGWKTPA